MSSMGILLVSVGVPGFYQNLSVCFCIGKCLCNVILWRNLIKEKCVRHLALSGLSLLTYSMENKAQIRGK